MATAPKGPTIRSDTTSFQRWEAKYPKVSSSSGQPRRRKSASVGPSRRRVGVERTVHRAGGLLSRTAPTTARAASRPGSTGAAFGALLAPPQPATISAEATQMLAIAVLTLGLPCAAG